MAMAELFNLGYGKTKGNVPTGPAPVETQFEPYQTNVQTPTVGPDPYAGMRGYQPMGTSYEYTQTPYGWDQASPGVVEQLWQGNQGRFIDPGDAAQWYWQNQGAFDAPGQGEQFWNQVQGDLASNAPGYDAYFDRARERMAGGINDQLAARGAFGSSAGMDQVSQGLADLNAQQASREADYGLNRLGALGGLAFQAQNAQLGRLGQGMGAAQASDVADLNRLTAGAGLAQAAQDARRQRGRDYMGDVFAPAGQMSALVGGTGQDVLNADQRLMDSAIGAELANSREDLNQWLQNREQERADSGQILNLIGNLLPLVGGGK